MLLLSPNPRSSFSRLLTQGFSSLMQLTLNTSSRKKETQCLKQTKVKKMMIDSKRKHRRLEVLIKMKERSCPSFIMSERSWKILRTTSLRLYVVRQVRERVRRYPSLSTRQLKSILGSTEGARTSCSSASRSPGEWLLSALPRECQRSSTPNSGRRLVIRSGTTRSSSIGRILRSSSRRMVSC